MIRDPSNGSVREPKKSALGPCSSLPSGESGPAVTPDDSGADTTPVIDPTTSGLQTGSTKPENIARLKKAREWLEEYHAKKNAK
jgi:hypothetical protein